ncbi:MAG TPA: CHASE3 domain-containing protein [Chitinophagaceae bacterium]|nr:CHASE3 domain-containing protein [Chitinophagaceae bacterium]
MPLRRKIRSGFIIAFILLMISYFFIFQSTWNVQREYDWVTNSYKAENKMGELRNSIVEAETGVRGYYITKDGSFLKPYHEAPAIINSTYSDLRKLEQKNQKQLLILDTIKQLIDLRLSLMNRNIAAFQQAGQTPTPEVDANRRRGQNILDSIRTYSQKFIGAEEDLMNKRKSNLTGFFKNTQIIIFISLLTSLLAILYSLFTYARESAARDESTRKNIHYQKELEAKIEELKRMDAEVKELKGMEKFTATGRVARTIAHEVRNPLTNISLAAEQLQDLALHNNESSMLLDMINRNTIRINQLVSDLLNATKAIELNIKTVSLNKILDESLEMAADRIDLGNIKVEKTYDNDVCAVAADEEKIKVAFLNIIVNAIEAMEKNKGVLKLRTKKAGDNCIVEVEDNGSGMDEDTQQKLFEPYFTNKPRGNGLGLTNCQNIILTHRGKITIQSKPGKGSVFTIILKGTG